MMKRLVAFTILFSALILTQCSKSTQMGKDTIASIDGEAITASDMFDRYPQARLADAKNEDIKSAVDDIVRRKVFVKDALAMGYEDSASTKAQVQNVEDQRLFQYVYEKVILDSLITEDVLHDLYDKMQTEIHARHILIQYRGLPRSQATRSKEEALALCAHILQQLKEGASFEDLANKYTEDPSGKNTGGDLGWFGWGKMVGPFQDVAFKLKVGEVSDIVETQFGLHIIKVEGRRQAQVKPFEEEKPMLQRMAARDKAKDLQKAAQDFIFNIKADNNFQILTKNVAAMYRSINAAKVNVGPLDRALNKINFDLPLFTLKGKTYMKDWVIKEIEKLPAQNRRTPSNENDFNTLLENMVIHSLIIQYGYDHNFNKDPEFAKSVKSTQDNIIYNNYVRDQINSNLNPTEKEIEDYYNEHKMDYTQKEMVHVQEVFVKDKALADKIYKQIQDGQDIGLMARRYTERPHAKETDGELAPFPAGRYGDMGKKAFTMKKGEISEPIKVGNGYSIIKLMDHIPAGPEPLERVKGRIKNDLNRVLRQKRADERYNELAKKYDVKINYDAAYDAYHSGNDKSTGAAS